MRNSVSIRAVIYCSLLLLNPIGEACDLCALHGFGEAYGAIGKGPSIGLAEQFTHSGTIQLDGHEVENPAGQYLDSSITQIVPGYNFTESIGVRLAIPLIYRHFRRTEATGVETGDESGLGDMSLFGTYEVYRREKKHSTFSLQALAGVKFPTGSTSRLEEETVESEPGPGVPSAIHGHDITLGSGSYDALLGVAMFARSHRFFASASLQYSIRTEGDFDYRFGNDVLWSAGPGYFVVLNEELTFSVAFSVSGESKALDQFQGASVDDTGFLGVYVGPELGLTVAGKLSATVNVDFPVLRDNTALQIVPDYRIRAGLTWRF